MKEKKFEKKRKENELKEKAEIRIKEKKMEY